MNINQREIYDGVKGRDSPACLLIGLWLVDIRLLLMNLW